MKIIVNPNTALLSSSLKRPQLEAKSLESIIADVFEQVEQNGDAALKTFSKRFDGVELEQLQVSASEFSDAEGLVSAALKTAIERAAANIRLFHESQRTDESPVETSPGVTCWRKSVPIQKVGLYIPGGSAPLFSTVLMLGIPADIANCPERILCTPPQKDGTINPAILFAAKTAGIKNVFKVGGAQAIAAMTLGTETIVQVDKLFGPGNQYVTAAKQFAQRLGTAIDMPAGPSEVLVAADSSVPPAFIAADLLAQAEHGPDSQVVFVTDSESFANEVQTEVERQCALLSRGAIAAEALTNSLFIVVQPEKWSFIINEYAPEHLIVMGKYEELILTEVVNAGSVFVGLYTAESFGDYASGTNHTLPTAGFARANSGVSLDSFVKKITYQRVTKQGLKDLGPTVMIMAEAESLDAHKEAIRQRLISIEK